MSSSAKSRTGNPFMMMMAMMGDKDMLEGKKMTPSKLRKDLLSSGDQIGHIFSSIKWDLPTQTVSFWMCDDIFQKFKDYHFSLIRTDGWYCLPHGAVKLGDAIMK
jgi:hypothetical protein